MPSLKALKNRAKSIKSTQKITKAMQMVAASKLQKARNAASQAAHYADALANLVSAVSTGAENSAVLDPFLGIGGKDKVLIVVFSSDRGLCGAFNGGIIKTLQRRLDGLREQSKDFSLIFIGKKAAEYFKNRYSKHILASHVGIVGKDVDYSRIQEITCDLLADIEAGEYNTCEVLYNHFQSAIKQVPTFKTIVPLSIDLHVQNDTANNKGNIVSSYSFDPSEGKILSQLLPQYFYVQIYNSALVSNASEHASRMNAMDNATRNSGDLIKKLNVLYNRTRQAYITKELIEIISGSEAV